MAVRHALTIALEAGFRRVIVEADCMKVIHHLRNKIKESSSFGCIIADILALVEQCNPFCFSHVRRTGKRSRHYDQMMVWVEDIPAQLQSFVLQDISFD
ncbi:Protein saal1 [Bienertia sinuspersici]